MNIKKILCLILAFIMISTLCLASCSDAQTEDDSESSSTSKSESENTENSESKGADSENKESSDTESETEEETVIITDVMIGETLEADYAADFSVARVFSSNMVVQRNEHIRVWGFAPESENGKKVSGEFKGMFAEAIIENGEWCITFGARLEADVTGAEMKIYTDKKTVTFEGVLVGDVYLVLGQSNAAYTVSNHLTYNNPTTQGGSAADINENSIIRLNNLNGSGGVYTEKGTDYVYSDLQNTKFWTKTTREDTLRFSALGYYFAIQMVEKNPTVPIGLMEVAVGGAPLISFLPNDIADEFGGDYKDIESGIYYSSISAEHQGRYLYNCYLAPVSRYAIAGILWYQGESNNALQNAMEFNETFAALMTRLRSTHNVVNKNFPVFITEFPTIYRKPAEFTSTWHFMELGIIRAYMGSIPTILKNSYVSASGDLWGDKTFFNNLHPNCKYEQSGRLASIADAVINQKSSLDSVMGPVFSSVKISEDKKTVILTFTNVGDGITTDDGGVDVMGIVGLSNASLGHSTVKPVSATVTGKDQITVVFDEPVKAVAYNYESEDHYGDTINICNSFGCPASGFVTPYEDVSLEGYKESALMDIGNRNLALKSRSFDTLTAGGKDLLPVGSIDYQLAAQGNIINVTEGTADLGMFGWIGFGYETLMFGYSIDGADVIFNTYPTTAGQDVINAGGKNAVRFNVHMNISGLSVGEHTVTLAAFVNLKEGVAVRLISFKINIVERVVVPGESEIPMYNDGQYGLVASFIDSLKADGVKIFDHTLENQLKENGNKVTVKKGTGNIRIEGWIGFNYVIQTFGYFIEGKDPVMNFAPVNPEQAVLNSAGQNGKRYSVTADISDLEAGTYTFNLLVQIDYKGEATILKRLSFDLVIEE